MAVNPVSLANLDKGREARFKGAVRVNVSLKPSTIERLKKLPLNVSASIDRIVEWVAAAGKVEEIFLAKSKDTHNGIEEVKLENIQDTHNRIEEVKLENIQDTHNRIEELELENIQDTHNRIEELELENQALKAELDLIKSKTDLRLPDAAILLNQLKAKRRKSKTDLQDVEAILELLPEMPVQQPQAQLPDLYAARDKLFEMPSVGGWKLEKGEKRERMWAFAEALIEEASKLNPDYSIIQRLQSDLKQEREYSQGIAKGMTNEFRKRIDLEKKMGLRRW